jgi:ankyrin repeat protein
MTKQITLTQEELLADAVFDLELEEVKRLIKKGVDINCRNENDLCPTLLFLPSLSRRGDATKMVSYLISCGLDVNAKNILGETPLTFACKQEHFEVVELLLKNGADVNASHNHGNTALHYASISGDWHTIETLIEYGADVNAVNNEGCTAMHFACYGKNTKIVRYLLKHGLDINAKNKKGRTPLDNLLDMPIKK